MTLRCRLSAALAFFAVFVAGNAWGEDDYSRLPPDTETLAVSHGGKLFLTAESAFIRIWDAKTGGLVRLLGGHKQPIVELRFSPDDKQVYSIDRGREFFVHDASSGAIVRRGKLVSPESHYDVFFTICERAGKIVEFARDGLYPYFDKSYFTVYALETLRPVRAETYDRYLKNIEKRELILKAGFNPDRTYAGMVLTSGMFILYDLRKNRRAAVDSRDDPGECRSDFDKIAVSADLKRYAMLNDGYLVINSLGPASDVTATHPIPQYTPRYMRFDAAGRYVVTDAYIFDAENGALHFKLPWVSRWDLFPDKSSLLMLNGGIVSTIDLPAKTTNIMRNYNTDPITLCTAAEDGSGLVLQTGTGRILDFDFRRAVVNGDLFYEEMGSYEYRNQYVSKGAKYAVVEKRHRTADSATLVGWDVVNLAAKKIERSFKRADFEQNGLPRSDEIFLKIIPYRGTPCLFAVFEAKGGESQVLAKGDLLSVVARDVKTGALRLRMVVSLLDAHRIAAERYGLQPVDGHPRHTMSRCGGIHRLQPHSACASRRRERR
ncbi:MAG: hypothetical protein JXD23_15025 [Spirochaetales bacterium]|nr:hypothetical protein [Spirochaetales bacterium]